MSLLAIAALAVCCQQPEPPPAQDPEAAERAELAFEVGASGIRYRSGTVPNGGHVCVVSGVRCGLDHDPPGRTGLARVVASWLRLRFDSDERTRELGISVRAIGPATCFAATVETEKVGAVLEAIAATLGGRVRVEPDLHARAVAQVKLRADDETKVLPGPMLFWRARRAMLVGDPRGRFGPGIPAELDAIEPAEVEEHLRRHFAPQHAFVVAVGGLDDARLGKLVDAAFAKREGADVVAPEPRIHDRAPAEDAETVHGRVDAPFVTAAIPALRVGDPGYAQFAIAMGVLRVRALRKFGSPRGGEIKARFDPVAFNYLDEPGVVLVNRRGQDGDSADRVRSEIKGLLADLRIHGAQMREVGQAAAEIARSLALPPFERKFNEFAVKQPRALYPRAWVMAMYEVFGWPADLATVFTKTSARSIPPALSAALAKDRVRWFALLPDPNRASGRDRK